MNISCEDALTWASWFRAPGDPTRVLILNLLATEAQPMTVNEIVEAVDVGQSAVSHHLKILGDVRFLLVDRQGTSSGWRINDRCLACFPIAIGQWREAAVVILFGVAELIEAMSLERRSERDPLTGRTRPGDDPDPGRRRVGRGVQQVRPLACRR
jgi:DNA-binding transcriptional ArsR family regulator